MQVLLLIRSSCNSFEKKVIKKIDAEKVETVKKYGFKVFTYIVNEKKYLQKVVNMKVDGIATDVPDKLNIK